MEILTFGLGFLPHLFSILVSVYKKKLANWLSNHKNKAGAYKLVCYETSRDQNLEKQVLVSGGFFPGMTNRVREKMIPLWAD